MVERICKLHPNVRIDYQSIGSGGGIKQIKEQTVDFGASDAPMKDEELKSAPGEILHIPTVLGAVVVTYNLEGISKPLQFSPEVIADIYLGKIKKWNDPKITADNAGVTLPAADITVVHRSDGSGTSAVFTDYLSKVSAEWKEKVGAGVSPSWPAGIGGKGNEGVTGQVKTNAEHNRLRRVGLRGDRTSCLPPTSKMQAEISSSHRLMRLLRRQRLQRQALLKTCAFRSQMRQEQGRIRFRVTRTFSFTKTRRMPAKGKALVDFLWWGIHDGESFAKELRYAPLPADIVKRAEAKINSITANGTALR